MESIQKDPLYPLVHSCATGYCLHCFSRHLCQSQYLPLRYVCMSQAKLQCELESQMYMAPCFLPPFSPVTVAQVIGVAFCKISLSSPPSQLLPWCLQIMALRLMLGAMLLTLAVSSTLKESVMMYKATKKWQPNHYMQLFVKDGILYFLSYVSLFPFLH